MPGANIIQLRNLLAEKFPGLRTRLESAGPSAVHYWPTGLVAVDELLGGGLPKNALVEMVAPAASCGSASLLRALLARAGDGKEILAVIDGGDSLDVTALDALTLSRLLWVRCRSAVETLKAADAILRDGNVSLVFIDLVMLPANQLRKIPATTWYRFQRLLEQSGSVCAVFTPRTMIPPAQRRLTLHGHFSLEHIGDNKGDWLQQAQLEGDVADAGGMAQHVAVE